MRHFPVRTAAQLAPLLVEFRKQAGLTQREVALRLGVTQQTYSALERHPDTVGTGRLLRLLNILGVQMILGEKSAPPNELTNAATSASDLDSPSW